jgi:serine/threonine protein kinase
MTTDPLSKSRDPLIGAKIDDRYLVQGVLGRGGMGVVYEGVHEQLERAVAIKVLAGGVAGDPVAVQRFLREARTASQLAHGNIVAVQDLGVLPDGRPYLVMPKMQGMDLAMLLRAQGPQSARRTVELLFGAAAGLDLIHAKGYVHRDVKPENLMHVVREDGSEATMLLDFGIVGLVAAPSARLTAEGSVFGTPAYLAPEAIQGDMPDRRGDVYALATVAFELMTGRPPFEAENPLRILPMKIMEDAPRMSEVAPLDFPDGIEAVIAKGLTRDPALRWSSAGEFVGALEAAVLTLEEAAGQLEPRSRSMSLRRSAGRAASASTAQPAAAAAAGSNNLMQQLMAATAERTAKEAQQLEPAFDASPPSATERLDTSQIIDGPSAPTQQSGPISSPTLSIELNAATVPSARRHWLGVGIAAGVLLGGVIVLARIALQDPTPAAQPPQTAAAQPLRASDPEPQPSAAAKPALITADPTALPTGVAEPEDVASNKPERPRPTRPEVRPRPAAKPAQPGAKAAPSIGAGELVQAAARELIQGHLNAAADLYAQATRLDPKSEPAFRGLGLTNERLGKKADAIRAFNRALALAPNGQNATMLRARLAKLQAAQ